MYLYLKELAVRTLKLDQEQEVVLDKLLSKVKDICEGLTLENSLITYPKPGSFHVKHTFTCVKKENLLNYVMELDLLNLDCSFCKITNIDVTDKMVTIDIRFEHGCNTVKEY